MSGKTFQLVYATFTHTQVYQISTQVNDTVRILSITINVSPENRKYALLKALVTVMSQLIRTDIHDQITAQDGEVSSESVHLNL